MSQLDIVKKPGVRQAAFFDLEKTLTPHATEQEAAVMMARAGSLPWSALARVLFIYLQYNLGLISNFEAMKRSGARGVFRGRHHQTDVQLMQQMFEKRLNRFIYPQALEAIARFKAAGFELYIVSATYRFMVEPYAQHLGIQRVYGVDLELDEGVCTGLIKGTIFHQQHKADVVLQAGRDGVALADSYAFGDSLNDLQMLQAVGHPVPVNPGSKLTAIARQRGWPVMRWQMP